MDATGVGGMKREGVSSVNGWLRGGPATEDGADDGKGTSIGGRVWDDEVEW